MRFWTYDPQTATVVIKCKNGKGQYRHVDPRDLLKFHENDIKTLSTHQISVADNLFEEAVTEFTRMVVSIVNTGLWQGGLQDAVVDYMEED